MKARIMLGIYWNLTKNAMDESKKLKAKFFSISFLKGTILIKLKRSISNNRRWINAGCEWT